MNQVNTLRDLFRHSDWAGQRVLEGASRLPDEQLDREFPMGFATLRKTLWHIYGAEHIWMQRLRGQRPTRFAPEEDRPSLVLRWWSPEP